VQRDVYEEFRQRLLTACEAIVVGDPADDKTLLGPVIHSAAADEIEQRIQAALKAGATLLMGNRREGNIIYPTIIENVPEACALIAEETFGPVVPLIAFDHIDEVIEQVNRSQYGLQAGVFSNDMQLIKRLFNELEVGTVIANDGPGFRADHFPFGGVKASGLGREGVKYAIREMSVLKTLVI
jgi:acyl-CoA reductase-like NAD-dependent aldehyde dehydrogenase